MTSLRTILLLAGGMGLLAVITWFLPERSFAHVPSWLRSINVNIPAIAAIYQITSDARRPLPVSVGHSVALLSIAWALAIAGTHLLAVGFVREKNGRLDPGAHIDVLLSYACSLAIGLGVIAAFGLAAALILY